MAIKTAALSLVMAQCVVSAAFGQTGPQPTPAVIQLLQTASEAPLKERGPAFDKATAKAQDLGDREGEGFGLELAGVTYLNQSEWSKAVDRLSSALAILRAVGDNAKLPGVMDHLGKAYSGLGQHYLAAQFYQKELDFVRAQKSEAGEIIARNNLANEYVNLGRLVEAQAAYEATLAYSGSKKDRRGEAVALSNLGEVFTRRSDGPTALGYLEQALPIFRDLKEQPMLANTIRESAVVHDMLGDREKALTELQEALDIWTNLGTTAGIVIVRMAFGGIYMKAGELAKARDELTKCLAILNADGNQVAARSTLLEFGRLEGLYGDKATALADDEQALKIATDLKDAHFIAEALLDLGEVNESLGQRGKAVDYYQRSLKALQDAGDRNGQARLLSNLGDAYQQLNETDEAFKCLNKALKIDQEFGLVDAQASDLNNLAVCYDRVGQFADALKSAESALTLWREVGDDTKVQFAYDTIGGANMHLGQYAEAKEPLQKALAVALKNGDSGLEAVILNNLAFCEFKSGDATAALTTFSKAVALEHKLGDLDAEAATCSNMLLFFEKQDAPGLAALYGKLAVNILQSLRSGAGKAGTESETAYRDSVAPAYRELARVLARMGRLPEAEQAIGLLKDSEYGKFLETRAAAGSQGVNLTTLEASWAQKYDGVFKEVAGLSVEYDALMRVATPQRTPSQQARLKEIDARFEACNTALEAFFQGARDAFSKANAAASRIDDLEAATGLTAVLKALPGHPAAIYTFLTQDGVHLMLNLPNSSVYREPAKNLPVADLNEKILAFRLALQDPRVDPRPLGSELYELLVRPIEKDLVDGKVDSLMWSLDSRLRYVPLWALYDSTAGKFLIEKYPSSLFTPRTVERQARDVHPGAWKGVEFGVSKGRTVGSLQFGALPGVPNELQAVSNQVGGAPKLDASFTRDAFDEALTAKPRIVHIATHFNFVPGDEKDSFMLFGTSELSVEEFKRMRNGSLDGVELLALSACDTANGDIRADAADGGEFESFALLAQLKGADAVLASLWPVNDSSTSLLMGEFYRLRKAHPEWTKLEALRQAQLELLSGKVTGSANPSDRAGTATQNPLLKNQPKWTGTGFSHPYYWAPFELIGNWK